MVSNDHNLAVASADADSKYLGGPAEPLRGSKDREYTGPLWPMSFRVELPPFSRIFWMDAAKIKVDQW
jgi:hypothetical protein